MRCWPAWRTPAWADENHDHAHNESNEAEQHAQQAAPDNSGDHDEHAHGKEVGSAASHSEEAALELTAEQQKMLNLQVITLQPDADATRTLTVPAEIISNQYRTWVVPVRIDSQVQSRSATLGQHMVKRGRPLPPCSARPWRSYKVICKWRRMAGGGLKTSAGVPWATSAIWTRKVSTSPCEPGPRVMASVTAPSLISKPEKNEKGVYTLTAPDDGLVLEDAFQQGQWLTAGSALVTLVDESELWAEAALPPEPRFADQHRHPGPRHRGWHIRGRQGDPSLAIASIPSPVPLRCEWRFPMRAICCTPACLPMWHWRWRHPENALTVPEEALTRSADGDWQLFVEEEPGHYKPVEIQLNGQLENRRIVTGIEPGTRVVTRGAFFLASEMAKSGFDIHNH